MNAMHNIELLAPLSFHGTSIHTRHEMLNLTDMWRAAGSDLARKPAEWARSADAERFVQVLATSLNVGNSHLLSTAKGRNGATWAHWQVALAYAKYLSPEFHMWCNTVVRERMEGRLVRADFDGVVTELEPAARQQIGGIVESVVAASLATALNDMLPAMVRDAIASEQYGVVKGVTAGGVLEMAGVTDRRGLKGLANFVSNRLWRFHAEKGVPVRRAQLGLLTAYMFDDLVAKEWLDRGGKASIEGRIAEKRGQGVLRLVPPTAPSAPTDPQPEA